MQRILIGDESDAYNSKSGAYYEYSGGISYAAHDVLGFLTGHRWDRYALAWVHGLRPSVIRVIDGEEHMDSIPWRVTVYIDHETRRITGIRQEILIACYGDIENAYDLRMKMKELKSQGQE